MGCRTLSLTAVATLGLLIIVKPDPTSAAGAFATMGTKALAAPSAGPRVGVHFRKTQSYYCYPRNYWWFYRPYTTAYDRHARCMPYFHYLEPYGRGGKPDRSMK